MKQYKEMPPGNIKKKNISVGRTRLKIYTLFFLI